MMRNSNLSESDTRAKSRERARQLMAVSISAVTGLSVLALVAVLTLSSLHHVAEAELNSVTRILGLIVPSLLGLAGAVTGFYFGQRKDSETPLLEVSNGLPILKSLDVSAVKAIQFRLSQLGFYAGPVDGSLGPATQSALEQFQMLHNLPATRQLDAATVAAIFMTPEGHAA